MLIDGGGRIYLETNKHLNQAKIQNYELYLLSVLKRCPVPLALRKSKQ